MHTWAACDLKLRVFWGGGQGKSPRPTIYCQYAALYSEISSAESVCVHKLAVMKLWGMIARIVTFFAVLVAGNRVVADGMLQRR